MTEDAAAAAAARAAGADAAIMIQAEDEVRPVGAGGFVVVQCTSSCLPRFRAGGMLARGYGQSFDHTRS